MAKISSSGHILIEYILGGAVAIVRGDQEAVAANNRDGVRRRTTTRKLRRLLRRVITSRYQTLDMGLPNHPLRQSTGGVLTRDGHVLFPIRLDATVMAELA